MFPGNMFDIREEIKTVIDETPNDINVYVADRVLPLISVNNEAGKIPITSTNSKKLNLDRAERSAFKRTELSYGSDTFVTSEMGIEIPVYDIEDLRFADFFDLEVDAGRDARQMLKTAIEKKVADAVLNSTTFASGNDAQAVTTDWLDEDCDIYTDVDSAAKKIKTKAGISKGLLSLTMDETVFNTVIRSKAVREDVKYTSDINSESIQAQAKYLASYLHIKEIILTKVVSDTTLEGVKTPSYSALWDDDKSMLGLFSTGSSWRGLGLGRQPVWSKFSNDYRIESYADRPVAANIIRARSYRGQKIFKKFGCLLTGVSS